MDRKFVLEHTRSPGDIIVMTACIRDIKRAYPDAQLYVATSAKDTWKHNPYVLPLPAKVKGKQRFKGMTHLTLDYGPGIREQNYKTVHFLQYFHNDFEKKTGLQVPVTFPTPDLHLSAEEKATSLVSGRYWIVNAGGKSDYTTKVWHQTSFQKSINRLREHGLKFVQIGSTDRGHWHPPMDGVLNLVGKTNLRDVYRLIHHADGVICGITMAMHAAAALQRPCVVLGGGREAWWWEAYVRENVGLICPEKLTVPHRYLHTMGQLDCCRHHGCWRNKTVPLDKVDKSICKYPISRQGVAAPKCMELITPEHVELAALSYYYDGTLPPPPDTRIAEDVAAMQPVSLSHAVKIDVVPTKPFEMVSALC